MANNAEFESLVQRFYVPLYQFAFSLTRVEADACELDEVAVVGPEEVDGFEWKSPPKCALALLV